MTSSSYTYPFFKVLLMEFWNKKTVQLYYIPSSWKTGERRDMWNLVIQNFLKQNERSIQNRPMLNKSHIYKPYSTVVNVLKYNFVLQ